MIFRNNDLKNDLNQSWHRPDRAFFAAGACHILADVFLRRFEGRGFAAKLILPAPGLRGTHVFVSDGTTAFDYHGVSLESRLLESFFRKIARRFPGWQGNIVPICGSPADAEFCGQYNHRMPHQYLHDPVPRAERFLDRLLVKTPVITIPKPANL